MKITVTVTETVLHSRTHEIEVPDNATDEQIENAINEAEAPNANTDLCMSYDIMDNFTEKIWIEYEDLRTNQIISYEK